MWAEGVTKAAEFIHITKGQAMTYLQIAIRAAAVGVTSFALVAAGRYALAPAYEGGTGYARAEAMAPVRGSHIDFALWYPAEPGGRAMTVGGNGVFYGTKAGRNATPKDGPFPLVLLSHGAGGNAGQFGWLATALTEAGYVVAIPNHPGSTSGNASAEGAARIWERPPDLSAVIDAIASDPATYPYIDTSDITAMGFSAGGYTAMAISGVRLDPAAMNSFCDGPSNGMSDCAFFAHGGVNLHDIDFAPTAQDMSDPRISRTVVIDPGVVQAMTPESLAEIDLPVLVINLGADTPAGVDATQAAALIPGATHQRYADAIHFSALAECKPKGADILAREGEPDPLCADAGGAPRAQIHADLADMVLDWLAAQR